MKRAYVFIAALVVVLVVGWVSSYLAFQAGSHQALGRETVTLVLTLDALEQIRDGNVAGATWIIEHACFRSAVEFLEDDDYQSDLVIRAATPRLIKYWDTHCANRTERIPYYEQRLETLLAQRR